MASESMVIEHVVLFKLKQNAPHEKIEAWLSALNALTSLDCVLHLCAAPATTPNCHFTHALYAQFQNPQALATYAAHPRHVAAVEDHGAAIVEDLLAVDWEAKAPCQREPCEALRIALLKPRNKNIANILGAYAKGFPSIARVSFGENISPGRAKGFTWGLLFMFRTRKDLEDLNHNEEFMSEMEDCVVMDCCV